jgi:cytochrome c oxidase subunit I
MNLVIHNTTWVPGHFHMTVGSAVALTLMGVAYWLIPYLTGRALWGRGVALASSWIYTIGVLIFARGMISAGSRGCRAAPSARRPLRQSGVATRGAPDRRSAAR